MHLGVHTFANTWTRVNMDVAIEDDGSANITQTIYATATSGSEFYYNFAENDISYSDFEVYQDGKAMTYDDSWDVDASLNEKAGKWGINRISRSEFELCFGKGRMGDSVYTLKYKINPLVRHYSDGKYGFNHNFYVSKFDGTSFSMNIRLANGEKLENIEDLEDELEDNDRVWAFGYRGQVLFSNGQIIVPDVNIYDNYNIIIMAQLKSEHGINAPSVSSTFEKVQNRAFSGSNYSKNDSYGLLKFLIAIYVIYLIVLVILSRSIFNGIFFLIWGTSFFTSGVSTLISGEGDIMSVVCILLSIFVPFLFFTQGVKKQRHNKKWKQLIDSVGYYRDCPKNLASTYAIVEPNKDVLKVKNANIVGAYIMEMIKENNLDVRTEEKVKLFGRVESSDLISFEKIPEDSVKLILYKILQEAAGGNGLLEAGELTNYAKSERGYNKLDSFFKICQSEGKKLLRTDTQIIKLDTYNLESYTEQGIEKLKELIGLQKYFKDFTLLDEREIKEVHNWGEMLVYATFLNVAKTVMDRLKLVIPEFNNEASEYGKLYRGTYVSDYFGRSMYTGYNYRQAQIEQASRSSGSGGSSSFGGGGGSSGGGGGGGSR